MTGFFLGGERITLRARFSQDSAMSMRGLEMKRRSRVSTVSGIPKNVRPRATALSGAGFVLGDAKSERREDRGLGLAEVRERAFDLDCPVVQWFRLAHGRLILWGFCYSPQRWGAFARESTAWAGRPIG